MKFINYLLKRTPITENPIGDSLAREMKIDLSYLEEVKSEDLLHRMTYSKGTNGKWILDCATCGVWVFDTEDETFDHVIRHSSEVIASV